MCRWRPTSDRADALIASLHHQPLLVVLRPPSPAAAAARIASLAAIGVRHIEIAWQAGSAWIEESAALLEAFPSLLLGAASIHSLEGLEAARQAGFSYGVSPILDQEFCHRAGDDLVLVPGVMTPTEVHHARGHGLPPGEALPGGQPRPRLLAAAGRSPRGAASLLHCRRGAGTPRRAAMACGWGGCRGPGLRPATAHSPYGGGRLPKAGRAGSGRSRSWRCCPCWVGGPAGATGGGPGLGLPSCGSKALVAPTDLALFHQRLH